MRRAFFVLGPESSGTRMLTKALMECGAYGDSSHEQRLDTLDFDEAPDLIVFRRSVPHAGIWPPIRGLIRKMEKAGYDVTPIVIVRNPHYTALSQVRVMHSPSYEVARERIQVAGAQIGWDLGNDPDALFVQYEQLVEDEDYRAEFFEEIGLEEPDMEFYNGNLKYEQGEEMEPALP